MNRKHNLWTGILAAAAMLVLILDTQTGLLGAREGIELCLYTVIPSLFPFFILSALIRSSLMGRSIVFLKPVCRLCGIPEGAESILLLGFFGGYPVGAQAITDTYTSGQIHKRTAQRLLGFCSNAGPAFLFGMLSPMFTSPLIPWILWLIHIVSAVLVGMALPGKSREYCPIRNAHPLSITQALERSVRTMASVCGWVIAFRVVLAVCDRWFLWLVPQSLRIGFTGLLELSNGCCELQKLPDEGLRFLFSACMLAFGGMCVGMQTVSVTKPLGTGMYFPGKLLQCLISFLLAGAIQPFLFPQETATIPPIICFMLLLTGCAFLIFLHVRKKVVAIQPRMMYNDPEFY